jgi:glycerophosphoryl diester phosphodiesterase
LWLDIKGNKDIFKYLEPVIRKGYARAAAQNRTVHFIAGMPSADVIAEYKKQPSYASLPTLCEQSVELAIENGSKYYAPRFTEGLVLDAVQKAKANGIKVLSWTLNDKNMIRSYLVNGQFDGMISDYPAYVVYDYYTLF